MRSVCYRGEPAIPMSKSGRQGLFLAPSGRTGSSCVGLLSEMNRTYRNPTGSSESDPMYGPAARRKRAERFGGGSLASRYPASD